MIEFTEVLDVNPSQLVSELETEVFSNQDLKLKELILHIIFLLMDTENQRDLKCVRGI